MTILSDKQILNIQENHKMIDPFVDSQKSHGILSYGLSSYGYDIRLSDEDFRLYSVMRTESVDPKSIADNKTYQKHLRVAKPTKSNNGSYFLIPEYTCALGVSIERFNIPNDVIAIAVGKSTYARCGINVIVTPLEPGWQGYLTLEIVNNNASAVRVYINEGILQLLFFRGEKCISTYSNRYGKYHNQQNKITLPIVK